MSNSNILNGIPVSEGISFGKTYSLIQPDLSFDKIHIQSYTSEQIRLSNAISKTMEEIEQIRDKMPQHLSKEIEVFNAHLMILSDPELITKINHNIMEKNINAESALTEITDSYISNFQNIKNNTYIKERINDIKDIRNRILSHLLGRPLPNFSKINEEVIIISYDLTPSDTAQLNTKFIKGFITEVGSYTSHAAIIARSLEIPGIVGVKKLTKKVKNDDYIAMNGTEGNIIIKPTPVQKNKFNEMTKIYDLKRIQWNQLRSVKTKTTDRKEFLLAANVTDFKDLEKAKKNNASSIGLYRTEFLYMNSDHLPSEDKQMYTYTKVLKEMDNKPVTIRTIDIGGDKKVDCFPTPSEANPFLGNRALRICLSKVGNQVFRTQIRALLRASIHGKLHIMFPMVSTLTELRRAKEILSEEKKKLLAERIKVSKNIKIGIMIEVPAAAIIADKFSKEVDFFSIGTNDLIQYTMAADRMNDNVSYLYQPCNPSILRLIKRIIDSAHAEGKVVGMCGEMAADNISIPLMVGMGLDEFSVNPTSILKTRSIINNLDSSKMKELSDYVLCNCDTNEEVIELVNKYCL